MGQGNYTMIVFGGFEPEDVEEEADKLYDLGIKSAYESEERWMGVPIVEDGSGCDDAPACWARSARPLSGLQAWVETEHAETLAKAKKLWAEAREAHPWLPEGELLFVADYD